MAKRFDSTNVLRLPTAASRKVQQPCNRWGRAARKELREATPWPGEYIHHQRRAAMRKAEILISIERTPALVLALAIFAELDQDTRLRVIGQMAKGGASGEVCQAIELTSTVGTTFGEQWDLMWAMDRLRGKADA